MKARFKLREAAHLVGQSIRYYPVFTSICNGNANAGIFLSLFYYWDGKQKDPEGWIYKSQADIKRETGLGRYSQESARKYLKGLGLCQEQRKGAAGRMHFLFDWDKVDEMIIQFRGGGNLEEAKKEMRKQARRKQENQPAQVRSTNQYYPAVLVIQEFYTKWMNWKCDTEDVKYSFEWTNKEKGQLKNFVNRFRRRLRNKKSAQGVEVKLEEICPETLAEEALRPFFELYLKMSEAGVWNMQSFTLSNIMTHLPDIISKMEIFHKNGTIKKTTSQKQGHRFDQAHAESIQRASNWGGS